MKNLANYSTLKSNLETIVSDWKSKENYYVSNNIGFGTSGFINIEMIGNDWRVKKSVNCKKEYNSFGRLIWSFFSTSTNSMVDELAELIENEIKCYGIIDLKVSVTLL